MTAKTADYVIVGAGAAGPILAARLSEDPGVQVVLLEAGKENSNPLGRMQGAFFLTWGSDMNWGYKTTPQTQLAGRRVDEPRGRAVGGSTAINVGAWLRGCAADYDAWEAQGATGWNWASALALFRSIEDTDRGPSHSRGRGGPLRMADLPSDSPIAEALLDAFVQAGYGPRGDANGETPYVADRYQTLFPDGIRCTPADAYLTPDVRSRGNLRILSEAFAQRVLFDGTRASGVTYTQQGQSHDLIAAREVILCAGAINTPQLLLLSGIGPVDELRKHEIQLVAHLPGVGANLHDHLVVSIRALAPETIADSFPSWANEADIARWHTDRKGPAAYWPQNGVGFIRTRSSAPGPDFELMFQYLPDIAGGHFAHVRDAASRSGYTISVIQLQPKSRGHVRLSSGDPNQHPIIDPAFLTHPEDLPALIAGVRAALRLTQTEALDAYSEHISPRFDESDEALAAWIRADAGIAFHPVGTARMGAPDDEMAVLDPQLRVRGVQGLRIADASAFPSIIRGHTMAPTVMLAERAAQLIRKGL